MVKTHRNIHISNDSLRIYSDTCIVPICTINPIVHRHIKSDDPFIGHKVVELATKNEKCMVWTPFKGTVNFDPDKLLSLYFNIFDTIARKGFRKIIVYYCGDMSESFEAALSYPTQYSQKRYTLYHVRALLSGMDRLEYAENDDVDTEQDREKNELEVAVNRLTEIIRCVKEKGVIKLNQ